MAQYNVLRGIQHVSDWLLTDSTLFDGNWQTETLYRFNRTPDSQMTPNQQALFPQAISSSLHTRARVNNSDPTCKEGRMTCILLCILPSTGCRGLGSRSRRTGAACAQTSAGQKTASGSAIASAMGFRMRILISHWKASSRRRACLLLAFPTRRIVHDGCFAAPDVGPGARYPDTATFLVLPVKLEFRSDTYELGNERFFDVMHLQMPPSPGRCRERPDRPARRRDSDLESLVDWNWNQTASFHVNMHVAWSVKSAAPVVEISTHQVNGRLGVASASFTDGRLLGSSHQGLLSATNRNFGDSIIRVQDGILVVISGQGRACNRELRVDDISGRRTGFGRDFGTGSDKRAWERTRRLILYRDEKQGSGTDGDAQQIAAIISAQERLHPVLGRRPSCAGRLQGPADLRAGRSSASASLARSVYIWGCRVTYGESLDMYGVSIRTRSATRGSSGASLYEGTGGSIRISIRADVASGALPDGVPHRVSAFRVSFVWTVLVLYFRLPYYYPQTANRVRTFDAEVPSPWDDGTGCGFGNSGAQVECKVTELAGMFLRKHWLYLGAASLLRSMAPWAHCDQNSSPQSTCAKLLMSFNLGNCDSIESLTVI
ncbi:hypothetical protein FB451DRAFT_1165903 [Mycena latifolia]|nr:hypothetical protein FB451DRAFT_1165903 [Mycena latifolia]